MTAKRAPIGDQSQRPKRLALRGAGSDRGAWIGHVKDASALYREQAATKLDERGRAVAKDRRRVWAGRAPELADVNHGPPGLIAREERTMRAFNTGEAVNFDDLEAGKTRVVWDERKKIHRFVKAVSVEAHTERRGGTLPDQARWHFSRATNKRELFERVDACGKAETARITVVCRDCKNSREIQVGCGSQWFCPNCRKRAMSRLRKTFIRNRLGLITIATRAGLTRRRQAKGQRWGERFLTLTLPHRGGPVERIEVLNLTWTRFWRTVRDELRPKLRADSGIRGEHLPNGLPAKRAEAATQVKRSYRAAATHRKEASTLERHDSALTGDFELALFDMLTYFRVVEWTPGDDGQGHPHIHAWLFSQYLDQAWLERHWHAAWNHVQRDRLHGNADTLDADRKHGPIEERKLIVHIEASREGVENELVKYLTKDWEVDAEGTARRVAPEVFAQVYAHLDGKRRRQSSAGFSNWGVEKFNACECCWFEKERGSWCRVDITHALDHHTENIGYYHPFGRFLFYDPDDPNHPDNGRLVEMKQSISDAEAELRREADRKRDAAWLDDAACKAVAVTMAPKLGVSVAWMLTPIEHRAPLEFERIRFLCEGEPEPQFVEPDQVELFAPQIRWPTLGPDRPLTLLVQAPPCPKAPPPFTGAMYGVIRERAK